MRRRQGIDAYFHGFRSHLQINAMRIAPLQFCARLEDYFTKEFVGFIHQHSHGRCFAHTNLGRSGERKFDVCIFKCTGQYSTFVEVKYLNNQHRDGDEDANDNSGTSLRTLRTQMLSKLKKRHAWWTVKPASRHKYVYGLVIASFVCKTREAVEKADWYENVRTRAKSLGFTFLDKPSPEWRAAYEDVRIRLPSGVHYASLRLGFWRTPTRKRVSHRLAASRASDRHPVSSC